MTEATIRSENRNIVDDLARGEALSYPLKFKRKVRAYSGAGPHNVEAGAEDIIQVSADGAVVMLPLAASSTGCHVLVQNVAADGDAGITVKPQAADAIIGTVGAVSSGGLDDTGWVNTKATALKGDYTELYCDGSNWFIIGGVGVWASEV